MHDQLGRSHGAQCLPGQDQLRTTSSLKDEGRGRNTLQKFRKCKSSSGLECPFFSSLDLVLSLVP